MEAEEIPGKQPMQTDGREYTNRHKGDEQNENSEVLLILVRNPGYCHATHKNQTRRNI